MLIGAGNAGQMILRDIAMFKEEHVQVCCIIDDNANKWGRYVGGIPVVGGRYDILKNVENTGSTGYLWLFPAPARRTNGIF